MIIKKILNDVLSLKVLISHSDKQEVSYLDPYEYGTTEYGIRSIRDLSFECPTEDID